MSLRINSSTQGEHTCRMVQYSPDFIVVTVNLRCPTPPECLVVLYFNKTVQIREHIEFV